MEQDPSVARRDAREERLRRKDSGDLHDSSSSDEDEERRYLRRRRRAPWRRGLFGAIAGLPGSAWGAALWVAEAAAGAILAGLLASAAVAGATASRLMRGLPALQFASEVDGNEFGNQCVSPPSPLALAALLLRWLREPRRPMLRPLSVEMGEEEAHRGRLAPARRGAAGLSPSAMLPAAVLAAAPNRFARVRRGSASSTSSSSSDSSSSDGGRERNILGLTKDHDDSVRLEGFLGTLLQQPLSFTPCCLGS
jgi:hypothetical protein